jgi:hypothetical protein
MIVGLEQRATFFNPKRICEKFQIFNIYHKVAILLSISKMIDKRRLRVTYRHKELKQDIKLRINFGFCSTAVVQIFLISNVALLIFITLFLFCPKGFWRIQNNCHMSQSLYVRDFVLKLKFKSKTATISFAFP